MPRNLSSSRKDNYSTYNVFRAFFYYNIRKIFGVVFFTFFITKISQYNTSSNVLKNTIKAIMREQGLWMSLPLVWIAC